jgi:hypothetical protein
MAKIADENFPQLMIGSATSKKTVRSDFMEVKSSEFGKYDAVRILVHLTLEG